MLTTAPEHLGPAETAGAPEAWLKALTLSERAATLPNDAVHAVAGAAHHSLMEIWKQQPPFTNEELFALRLLSDRLSEQEFSFLLSESHASLRSRFTAVPVWVEAVDRALSSYEENDAESAPMPEGVAEMHGAAFLRLILPVLQPELKRLREGACALTQLHPTAHNVFRPDDLSRLLLPNLVPHIIPRLSRTIALEVNIARLKDELRGDSPEERFQNFIEQASQPDRLRQLFDEYPVLARQLMLATHLWVDAELELLERLVVDWDDIRRVFANGEDPGQLIRAAGELGDSHAGARTVHCLEFTSGLKLIYKPKPLAVDLHFQELLNWLNEAKQFPEFRTISILDRGAYGWSEFVRVEDCEASDGIERFYESQGCFLALLYALEATDFHCENLIAAGEQPVLIDLEALFHPRIESYHYEQSPDPAVVASGESVLRVGLLPEHLAGGADAGAIDVSGLGGGKAGGISKPVPAWEGFATDTMSVVRKQIKLAGADNLPRLRGADIEPAQYVEHIVRGFEKMYRFIVRHRQELWDGPVQRFRNDCVRIVFRATKMYTNILRNSYHPDLLRDALERERFLDSLWCAVPQQPYLARLIAAERADLQSGDIPIFTCSVASRDVRTSRGVLIEELLQETSLQSVRRRLEALGDSDLQQQVWFIRASFAAGVLGDPRSAWKSSELQPARSTPGTTMLLEQACAAGDRLMQLAAFKHDRANWVTLAMEGDRNWQITPAKYDLYGGTSGIILFLAYLGAVTGEARYSELARAGLRSVQQQVRSARQSPGSTTVGAFSGLGSVIYLLAHLASLWKQAELLQEADEVLEMLCPLIAADDSFDIVTGSAGCISSLLALHRVSGSKMALGLALECGGHLVEQAQVCRGGVGWVYAPAAPVPLTGFSHGSAGIALSLMRLSNASGDTRFRDLAQSAIEYERGVFSREHSNWPDFREVAAAAQQYQASWCHGSAGIGMARLGCVDCGAEDAEMSGEVEAALASTRREGFGLNHSLCHGDLGNLELFLLAARAQGRTDLKEECGRLIAKILESIRREGWCTGLPLGFEAPGLMTGIAGIGYQLLRCASPETVPSVLILEPPVARI